VLLTSPLVQLDEWRQGTERRIVKFPVAETILPAATLLSVAGWAGIGADRSARVRPTTKQAGDTLERSRTHRSGSRPQLAEAFLWLTWK